MAGLKKGFRDTFGQKKPGGMGWVAGARMTTAYGRRSGGLPLSLLEWHG
jgi:hypothetical protein